MFIAFVQFIVGLDWSFLLTGIVYALMLVVTNRQRPTLLRETFGTCVKIALLGVFPYLWAVLKYKFMMGTMMYAAVTFTVALSFTTIRIQKLQKRKFELANEQWQKSEAMMKASKAALSIVEKPDTNEPLQSKRCDLLKSLWECLTPKQRKVALLLAEGNMHTAIGGKPNIAMRIVTRDSEPVKLSLKRYV